MKSEARSIVLSSTADAAAGRVARSLARAITPRSVRAIVLSVFGRRYGALKKWQQRNMQYRVLNQRRAFGASSKVAPQMDNSGDAVGAPSSSKSFEEHEAGKEGGAAGSTAKKHKRPSPKSKTVLRKKASRHNEWTRSLERNDVSLPAELGAQAAGGDADDDDGDSAVPFVPPMTSDGYFYRVQRILPEIVISLLPMRGQRPQLKRLVQMRIYSENERALTVEVLDKTGHKKSWVDKDRPHFKKEFPLDQTTWQRSGATATSRRMLSGGVVSCCN